MSRFQRFLLATVIATAGLGLATRDAGADGKIIIQPHLEGGGGKPPENDVDYKVRDSDGNLVASGSISPGDGENTATVDLPPGDYTVETYSDQDDGGRLGGEEDVTVREGGTSGRQVEMDEMTPEEDLEEQIEDLEDRIDDAEDQVEHIEDDIDEHRRNGEDDAIEPHEEEIESLEDRIERMQRQLRRKRAQLRALRRRAQDDLPDAPHMRVPTVPMEKGGSWPKGGGKKY